jgi:hypothetical protein
MQTAGFSTASETTNQSSRRHIQEDSNLNQCCKNFNHMTGSCLCACGMKHIGMPQKIHALYNRFSVKFSDENHSAICIYQNK